MNPEAYADVLKNGCYELSGEELIHYMTERAAAEANRQVITREDRRVKRTTLYATLFAIMGLGAIMGAMSLAVNSAVQGKFSQQQELLNNKINQTVSLEIESQIGELKRILEKNEKLDALSDLSSELARSREKGEGFTNDLRDKSITLITELATNNRITAKGPRNNNFVFYAGVNV